MSGRVFVGNNTMRRLIVLILLCTACFATYAQNLNQLYSDVYAKSDEARRNLRAAIVRVRDVRTTACNQFGGEGLRFSSFEHRADDLVRH